MRGMISPAEFIPLAESTGLIRPLGDWVLRTACQQLATWATDPEKAHWRLSINISGRQLSHDNFAQEVEGALRQNGFDQARAAMLEFEITETMLMQNIEASVRVINQLSAMGIHFAMDDFGTGYSSLSYLKMLPLNCVKIDQTFVRDMLVDQGDSAIVEMVIALAKTLELEVVAEGVETLEQHRALVELGCDFMQGYYYGKPARLKELVSQDTMSRLPL